MGRTRTFDVDVVVRAARAVFWQHGYEGASLPDLERATGLNRSSIYHAFASKRGLFDAVVVSYLDEVVRPRLQPLTAADVDEDAVIDYLSGLRDAMLSEGSLALSGGCLLLNAASAPIAHDEAVAEVISAYCDELRTAIGRGIAARLPEMDERRRERLTEGCVGLVISAFTLVRIDPREAARCLDTARAFIDDARIVVP